jgi:hypothetical protein
MDQPFRRLSGFLCYCYAVPTVTKNRFMPTSEIGGHTVQEGGLTFTSLREDGHEEPTVIPLINST